MDIKDLIGDRFRYELERTFDIEHTVFSPLGWLGGFASSQVFLICRNR